jgi:hypothetical protein
MKARQHLKLKTAAARLAHCTRWVLARIDSGELEGFKHGRRDVTVSIESIEAYEQRTRIAAGALMPSEEQSAA